MRNINVDMEPLITEKKHRPTIEPHRQPSFLMFPRGRGTPWVMPLVLTFALIGMLLGLIRLFSGGPVNFASVQMIFIGEEAHMNTYFGDVRPGLASHKFKGKLDFHH